MKTFGICLGTTAKKKRRSELRPPIANWPVTCMETTLRNVSLDSALAQLTNLYKSRIQNN